MSDKEGKPKSLDPQQVIYLPTWARVTVTDGFLDQHRGKPVADRVASSQEGRRPTVIRCVKPERLP